MAKVKRIIQYISSKTVNVFEQLDKQVASNINEHVKSWKLPQKD